MDSKQLRPIEGLPPLMYPSMLCSFIYHRMYISLRCLDPYLQRIQAITRMTRNQLEAVGIEEEFKHLGRNHFRFLTSLDDPTAPLHDGVMYCFSRHTPCKRIEKKFLPE